MLAQGQSSSAKRGGLAVDVSSGLIFLQKKKKILKKKTYGSFCVQSVCGFITTKNFKANWENLHNFREKGTLRFKSKRERER